MRSQFPQDPLDRITDLERELETLRAEVSGLHRKRDASRLAERNTFLAITAEWYSEGSYSYPAQTDLRLPILLQSWELDDDGIPTYTGRTEYASSKAFCPFGWYPPGIKVECYWNGEMYVVYHAPQAIPAVSTTAVTAATWSSGVLTPGSGTAVAIDETTLEKQEYESGSEVEMTVKNYADAVADDKGLLLTLLPNRDWAVVVEPCELTYA